MPTPRYLIDTNVIIALIRVNELGRYIDLWIFRDDTGRKRVDRHRRRTGRVRREVSKWAALTQLVATLTTHNLDDRFIAAYGEIDTASHAIGHKMGKNDLWIAATARRVGIDADDHR